ncbi:hypothetical protein [Janibacter melonis]|uniref:hypothetical protein n=1 Tax=Janibacter melonis TaxID=262209 RepID=UPI0017489F59|nr:hypothetical protein [Janibacter melonis]
MRRRVLGPLCSLPLLALAACGGERVAIPPDDATPEEVVRAYTDALAAQDCETAEEIASVMGDTWCGEVQVGAATVRPHVRGGGAGNPAQHYPEVVTVPVSIVVEGGDASLPAGETAWGYLLVRRSESDPWRVASEGVG